MVGAGAGWPGARGGGVPTAAAGDEDVERQSNHVVGVGHRRQVSNAVETRPQLDRLPVAKR